MPRNARYLFLPVLALASSAATQQAWTEPAPAFRWRHSAAFDAARDRTVVFGGRDHTERRATTWLWDGADWSVVATPMAPSAREGHAMVWDAARQRVVLFGGEDDSGSLGDTWTWDGGSWTLETPANAPPARAAHCLSWDPLRGVAVLFGGYAGTSGNALADTWEWDGTDWTLAATSGPLARWAAAMAWDGTQTALFGGSTGTSMRLDDTWTWNGTTWTQQATPVAPVARLHHGMVSTGNEAILFGGLDGAFGQLRDTWTWSGGTWSQASPVASPSTRDRAALAFDATRGETVLFGGLHVEPEADTWTYDGIRWQKRAGSPPGARAGAALATHRTVPVLFGGLDAFGQPLGDTWTWNGQTWDARSPVTQPPPRSGHGLAFDPLTGRTVLFGGRDAAGLVSGTWEWTGSDWNRRFPITSPPLRSDAAVGYFGRAFAVAMFGGFGASGPLDDTWLWNGASGWRQVQPVTSPSPRDGACAVADPRSDLWVMFGGQTQAGASDETWLFDGSDWAQLIVATPPPARRGATLTFEPQLATLVLLGGRDAAGQPLDDAWAFDGSDWAPLAIGASAARSDHAAVWDPQSQRILVHGGEAPGSFLRGDTRLLGHEVAARTTTFGVGCPGSAGTPALVPAPFSRPWLGDTFALEIRNVPSTSTLVFVVLGFDDTVWNGLPLPIDLTSFGLTGCQGYVAPFSTDIAPATGGAATWTLSLPPSAALQGSAFYNQAMVLDPGVNQAGATMSNATASTAALR